MPKSSVNHLFVDNIDVPSSLPRGQHGLFSTKLEIRCREALQGNVPISTRVFSNSSSLSKVMSIDSTAGLPFRLLGIGRGISIGLGHLWRLGMEVVIKVVVLCLVVAHKLHKCLF